MTDFDDAKATAQEAKSFVACKFRLLRAINLDATLNDRDARVGSYVVERYIHKRGNNAHPGFERLAAELPMSASTIKRAMRQLVRRGYLIPGRVGGGRGKANEYTVSWSEYDNPQTRSDATPFSEAETRSNQSKKPGQI